MNPQGPKIEDQGPWKLGVTQNFCFTRNKLSFETLNIKIGPHLAPLDPKNRPQNPQSEWGVSG
jgi:hypothetical protein